MKGEENEEELSKRQVLVTALALLSFAANADRTSDDLTPQSEKKGRAEQRTPET